MGTEQGDEKKQAPGGRVEPLVICGCGGMPIVRPGALFGSYVECQKCKKYTKIYGMEKNTIKSWNFDGWSI